MGNTLFPIFLKTDTFRFLIVGGGNVGLEKTNTLLKQNPFTPIKVVAKEINAELRKVLENNSHVEWAERSYSHDDLEFTDFVIIATENTVLNTEIRNKANERGILVNAADQPDLCDFYLGSIVKKDHLKIAISTNGKSPVLARRLREHLEESIPENINDSIVNLNAFREQHKGDLKAKLDSLNSVTEGLVTKSDKKEAKKATKKYKRLTFDIAAIFLSVFFGYGLATVVSFQDVSAFVSAIPSAFFIMILVGFFAQLVDGALGLGYGVTCATSMMLFGVKLPAISGSIHTAEMFSSGITGFSHYKFGNVNKKLLLWLAVPGVVGAVSGALLLVYFGSKYEKITYTVLATYTMFLGVRLMAIAFRKKIEKQKLNNAGTLGFAGGFLDAFGGGGWGPIVTSTLLGKGRKSSYVVGTVSLAEFFVTLAASITFFASLGVSHWYIVAGLILGGSLAAPFAARLAGKLPQKTAILLVAFLVIVFSVRMLFKII